jgi:ribosome-associated protein
MVLDVAALTTVANYLVIASGDSVRQVKAIAEAVDEALDAQGVRLLRSEGLEHGRWVLLDYGGIVVHVFHREAREFYRIERLWADAPMIDLPASRPDARSPRPAASRNRERLITPSEPG